MNLWANIDNNQQLSAPNGNGGREGARRPTEGDVLSAQREWLLQDYAASYCRSLAATRIYRRCYWLDGLGALGALNRANVQHEVALEPDVVVNGQKEKKQKKKNGPDLVVPVALKPIATLSRQLASEQPSIALHGLMFAAGSSKKNMRKEGASRQEKTGKGEASAKSMVLPSSSSIMATSWLEAAPVLLKEIEQVPAIFLLNPFGQTMFSHEELSQLYQRTAPTELCFLIVHKQMYACLRAAQHIAQQARLLTALLRTDRWKTLPEGEEKAQQAVNECIGMFLSSMKRQFTFPVQSIALSMQTRPAFVEEMPYTLIFATRRQDSLFSMNDAVCEYRRRINEQSHYGVLGEEWFAAQWQERVKAAQRALYQNILQRGSVQRTRRWPDLRQQVLLAHFGQFKVCDYDDIIGQLLANGEVRYEVQRTSIEGESQPLPAHDDILVWNK
jgi:hypothetical protein